MREISELIYETCKTYLVTQGKFLILLWAFIAAIIVLYFGCAAGISRFRACRSFLSLVWWGSRVLMGWRGLEFA